MPHSIRFAPFATMIALAISACSAGSTTPEPLGSNEGNLAGSSAAGTIPAGLPARMLVGLFEDTGNTWMKTSGVKWDARYRYFTKGWVNNWGFGAYDGSWGLGYMQECAAQGFIPAIQYYQMNGEAGGGEAQFYAKTQNAATMKTYFGDFKLLMQRAKDFGKPVLVLLEGDGFGFLEQQTSANPNAPAAVASTGLPELAGLPNTVAGWGLAFLQMRKAAGATNAILGIHVSAWASGKDVAYFNVTDPLQPEVDKVYSFLTPFGLTNANAVGASYDVLVGDPLDRDSDFYRLTQNQDRWWDASDTASISSKSFNRYAEWLRLWNQTSSKRWVLWQIPLGNSNHLDVPNNGNPREGYKDNRPEYFFNDTAHIAKFADSGVISLLFGAGASGQSWYTNDVYTDGKLFMQTHAGQFLNAGGLAIASGSTGTGSTTGGTGSTTGSTSSTTGTTGSTSTSTGTTTGSTTGSTGGTGSDTARYSFESGTQSWAGNGGFISAVGSSTARAFAGTHSLEISINASAAGTQHVAVPSPGATPGKVVTFHIFVPAGAALASVQPYVLQNATGNWTFTGNWKAGSSLTAGNWNTISVTVPSNAAPLFELGVELSTSAAWSGKVYVDSVNW